MALLLGGNPCPGNLSQDHVIEVKVITLCTRKQNLCKVTHAFALLLLISATAVADTVGTQMVEGKGDRHKEDTLHSQEVNLSEITAEADVEGVCWFEVWLILGSLLQLKQLASQKTLLLFCEELVCLRNCAEVFQGKLFSPWIQYS